MISLVACVTMLKLSLIAARAQASHGTTAPGDVLPTVLPLEVLDAEVHDAGDPIVPATEVRVVCCCRLCLLFVLFCLVPRAAPWSTKHVF